MLTFKIGLADSRNGPISALQSLKGISAVPAPIIAQKGHGFVEIPATLNQHNRPSRFKSGFEFESAQGPTKKFDSNFETH